MRSSTFSSFAILAASFLVRGVTAGPIGKRALVIDTVIITDEVVVTVEANGSLDTGLPFAVGTTTITGSVVASPPSIGPAVLQQQADPTSSTTSTTSTIPIYAPPTPKSSPAYVAPAAEAPPPASPTPVYVAPAAAAVPATPVAPVYVAPAVVSPPTSPKVPAYVPPTTPATSAPSVATIVSPGSSTGGKRGVAYNDASCVAAFSGNKAFSWVYNWGDTATNVPSGFEFVPMLWGTAPEHSSHWQVNANKAIAAGSTHLLAFNEPDLAGQATMSYGDAAAGYLQFMQPFAGKAKLGAPAVTNGAAPMGLTYLSNFLGACKSCTIDFINIHWYTSADAAAFKAHVANAYAVGGNRPIWITEFQAPGSLVEQATFLAEVIPWLDSQHYVERYAYFMAQDGILMSGTSLSSLGKAFASLT